MSKDVELVRGRSFEAPPAEGLRMSLALKNPAAPTPRVDYDDAQFDHAFETISDSSRSLIGPGLVANSSAASIGQTCRERDGREVFCCAGCTRRLFPTMRRPFMIGGVRTLNAFGIEADRHLQRSAAGEFGYTSQEGNAVVGGLPSWTPRSTPVPVNGREVDPSAH